MFKTKNPAYAKASAGKQKGFTLLELLVVIGIIGLLASIIVVNLSGARKKARDAKRVADIRNIQSALEDYYDSNGSYPLTINVLVTANMLSTRPIDPLAPAGTICAAANSDNCYFYAISTAAAPRSYHLGASLEGSNPVLNQDRDCDSTTGTNCPYTSAYVTRPFTSVDTAGCGGLTAGKFCYDLAQ